MKNWFACLLFATPSLANSAAIQFNFTGVVTSAVGIYSDAPIGSSVVGIYTFDVDAAIPEQSLGAIGSYDDLWTAVSVGGSFYIGFPEPPVGLVFSTSGHVVGTPIMYDTGPINGYQNYSGLQGYGNLEEARRSSLLKGRLQARGIQFGLESSCWTLLSGCTAPTACRTRSARRRRRPEAAMAISNRSSRTRKASSFSTYCP